MVSMMLLLLVEGWMGVFYRHILIEDCGSTYVRVKVNLVVVLQQSMLVVHVVHLRLI